MYYTFLFKSEPFFQQEGGGGGNQAETNSPPTSLLAEARRVFTGDNNLDKTLVEFILHAETDQREYFIQRLREYEAMLHLIGVLAGVHGTQEEQETLREEVKSAINSYLQSVNERVEESEYQGIPEPGAVITAKITSWWYRRVLGNPEEGARIANNILGGSQEANRITHEAQMRLTTMIADFLTALWDALRNWYNNFWETVEEEGVLIALNRAKIDLMFFAAECAIDIAITAALGGIIGAGAAAALKSIRFIGTRVAGSVTRVTIKALPDTGIPVKLIDKDVLDVDIAPDIDQKVLDEDLLGSGSALDDAAERSTPTPTTPKTTVVTNSRGPNTATYEIDPDTGHPISAEATLRQDFGQTPRGDNATEVGGTYGGDGYDGGHLIAHRFMGDTIDGGIAPQIRNLNRGAYSRMENEWGDWLTKYKPEEGAHVEIDVKIDVVPPGSENPDKFLVQYRVYEVDADGSKTLLRSVREEFLNQDGQTFDRVYFRDDGSIISNTPANGYNATGR